MWRSGRSGHRQIRLVDRHGRRDAGDLRHDHGAAVGFDRPGGRALGRTRPDRLRSSRRRRRSATTASTTAFVPPDQDPRRRGLLFTLMLECHHVACAVPETVQGGLQGGIAAVMNSPCSPARSSSRRSSVGPWCRLCPLAGPDVAFTAAARRGGGKTVPRNRRAACRVVTDG